MELEGEGNDKKGKSAAQNDQSKKEAIRENTFRTKFYQKILGPGLVHPSASLETDKNGR